MFSIPSTRPFAYPLADLQRLIHEHHANLAMFEITEAAHSAAYLKVMCSRREIARILTHIDSTETEEFAQGVAAESVFDKARAFFDHDDSIESVAMADLSEHVAAVRAANGLYATGPTGLPAATETYDPFKDEDACETDDSPYPPRSPRTRNPNLVPPPLERPPLKYGVTTRGVLCVSEESSSGGHDSVDGQSEDDDMYVETVADSEAQLPGVPFSFEGEFVGPGEPPYPPSYSS